MTLLIEGLKVLLFGCVGLWFAGWLFGASLMGVLLWRQFFGTSPDERSGLLFGHLKVLQRQMFRLWWVTLIVGLTAVAVSLVGEIANPTARRAPAAAANLPH